MPYIHLRHTDPAAALAAAPRVAGAVATALGLAPGDVIVSVSAAAGVCDGSGQITDWPSLILHGRRRDPDRMDTAIRQAVTTLALALGVDAERVWAQWSVA